MLPSDPSRLGFPTNTGVTSLFDELKENDIWLCGIVDRDLLLLSTKEIWLWLGRMGDPQDLVLQ
jgi:hypothetical protein